MENKHVFVIRNQLNQYFDKHTGWHSGKDASTVKCFPFHDEALNTLLEINAKDITLRGKILEVPIDEKKRPHLEVDESAIALDHVALMAEETDSDETDSSAEIDSSAEETSGAVDTEEEAK